MKVEFNKPYSVKVLMPGSPSRFWLSLLESTRRDEIEEQLRQKYEKGVSLRDPPCPGTFIVCFYSKKFCRGKVVYATVSLLNLISLKALFTFLIYILKFLPGQPIGIQCSNFS